MKKELLSAIVLSIFAGSILYPISLGTKSVGGSQSKSLILRPNGPGSITRMTAHGDSPNWKCMDEDSPDEFTTYCTTDNTAKRDLYAFPNHGTVSGTIQSVEVKAMGCSHPYAETENGKIFLKTHGVEYSQVKTFRYHVWEYLSKVWTVNPYTGEPWTWEEIDDLQAGCGYTSNQATAWTWIAVIVTYISNSPPNSPTLTSPVASARFDPDATATFTWIFNDPDEGDSQSAYRFQLDDNSDFSSPIIDTGKVTSASGSTDQVLPSTVGLYYWRVKTWDSQDTEGEWSDGREIVVDRIKVISGGVVDNVIDVDSGGKVWYQAVYEYDNSPFTGSCGILYLNGSAMIWNAADNRWEYCFPYVEKGSSMTFQVTGVVDNTYGLTELNNSFGDITINWSAITIKGKK